MVETITPVVHGGRRRSYRLSLALHVTGATASAAALGAVAGAAGGALGAPWGGGAAYTLAGLSALYLLRELGAPVPVVEARRQVPEWWRRFFSPPVAALLYGLGLGVGFYTHLRHGTFVVVVVVALAAGDPAFGALACAPFGLVRGLSVRASRRIETAEDADVVLDRLAAAGSGPRLRAANAAALALVVAAVLAAL